MRVSAAGLCYRTWHESIVRTMSSATIYDVAKEAKVSIATVSRVINSPQRVNEETRQRVLAAIDKLSFIPRAEASARARKNSRRIGVLTPFFTHPSFVQRLRGVTNVLDNTPYELVIYPINSVAKCRSHLESIPVARRIDGLVLISLLIDDAIAERLQHYGLQTVLIETAHPAFSGVEIDNQQGGYLAGKYLLGKGHVRIGFVGGDEAISGYTPPVTELRHRGWCQAMREADVPIRAEYVKVTEYGQESARQAAHQLLAQPEPPTAIFAMSDTMAMGVLKAARERGVRVPDDLAVIGFDALDMAEYIGLTTISQALDESGRIAVELLLARLAEPSRPVQHVKLPLKILIGETA